jgi:Ca-activated chloride channel homolog
MRLILIATLALAQLHGQDGQTPTFTASVRLVEVYATVHDRKDRHVADLKPAQFELFDAGKPQGIEKFEAVDNSMSIAIVLDTTGSMRDSLPAVKNATGMLIDQLREGDSVAVYGFSAGLDQLQGFTTDKRAAKLAVRRTRAEGKTALFDALARVAQELAQRPGKKAILVFTDGNDNSSVLNLESAALRARKTGVPVYTVAQGEALHASKLMKTLEALSEKTGALSFKVRKSSEMNEVFLEIAKDLRFTYLLAYRPPVAGTSEWRPIQVVIKGLKDLHVRCKEGYFAN